MTKKKAPAKTIAAPSGPVVTKTVGTATVLIDSHQGKHVVGVWPGYTGQKGAQFLTAYVSGGDASFLWDIWDAVKGTTVGGTATQGDVLVDCGKTKIGTGGETVVWVQWGKDSKAQYCFHAYPVTDGEFATNKKKKPVVQMTVGG